MAEEFLNCADVIAVLKQMGRKGMSECVRSRWLCQPGLAHGLFHRILRNGFVQVMSALLSGCAIGVVAGCEK